MSGNFDPCECVWSHEGAMQRLISMLRQSQDSCTDSECFTGPIGPQQGGGNDMSSLFMIFMGWLLLVGFLFLARPNSMRRRGDVKQSPDRPHRDGNDQPPPPTAT